ncbi:MAG: lipase family alpha/beta hydrolase [Mycobacteriales bacterium]
MLASLSPTRRRFVLALAGLVVAALAVVGFVAIGHATSRVGPVSQAEQGPVLLVSGYGGDTASLEPLARALEAQGRDATIVPPVSGGTGDLRAQAARLGEAADAARSRTGAASVDVVGYSAGGVVARLWVSDFGGDGVARRVVTLDSPHHGTDVASLALETVPGQCPLACQQLAPDSPLLASLNAGDETPTGPRFVSIWSDTDEVVTPPDSARLEGALDFTVQDVCGNVDLSHGQVPGSPLVLAAVPRLLGVDNPAVPPAALCRR